MNIRSLLVLAAVLVVASCERPDDTAMDGVPGCTTGNHIEISYPADSGKASANPDCLHVKRPGGSGAVIVTFKVNRENGKDTKIEFTQGTASDCRTPLPPKGGRPQCVVTVPADGGSHAINIAEDQGECDSECEPGEIDCMKDHCSYKYSVQDVAGNHELLDPEVITDPH